jgi:hypothetical protein
LDEHVDVIEPKLARQAVKIAVLRPSKLALILRMHHNTKGACTEAENRSQCSRGPVSHDLSFYKQSQVMVMGPCKHFRRFGQIKARLKAYTHNLDVSIA